MHGLGLELGVYATPGIGRRFQLPRRFITQRIERHVRRAPRRVGETDVERRGNRMVAGHRRVVARRARAGQRFDAEIVVQSFDALDQYRA